MRVAVVDQTGNAAGGAQRSLESFLRNAPQGVEPSVVFFETGPFADRIASIGIPVRTVSLATAIARTKRERLNLAALQALPATVRTLVAALRAIAPDVIYTNGVKAHVLGALAARILSVPCVPHHRDILTGPTRLLFLTVVAVCTRARIATSANVARCYPLPHTTIIDNPVELASYRALPDRAAARATLGIENEAPLAAIVGRINRWKGVDRFLRALAMVNERERLRGLVVGAPRFRDSELLPELRALQKTLGLEELVTFIDWIDDPRDIYAAIDINVNTSDREPFGRTIIEAAACGVPSVCFDDAGVSETMRSGETGIVVPAHDESRLAEALQRYAADAAYRTEAGAAARAWSQRFDASLYAHRVAETLATCVR